MDSPETVRDILRTYYAVFDARSGNAATLDAILAPGWKNYSSDTDYADKPGFLAILTGIQQAVPDLRWRIAEVLIAGDRVTVRGEGSGRIQCTYHLEDWAGALRQLAAPARP